MNNEAAVASVETQTAQEGHLYGKGYILKEQRPKPGTTLQSCRSVCSVLLPHILGLMCARTALVMGTYGSYAKTDEGLYTDGSMLIALIIIAAIWFALWRSKQSVKEKSADLLFYASSVIEAISLLALAFMAFTGINEGTSRFIASCTLTLSAAFAMICWLRHARGASNTIAVVYAFVPLVISEVLLLPFAFMPQQSMWLAGAVIALLQIPCLIWSRSRPAPYSLDPIAYTSGYFGMSVTGITNKRYLIATAVGIGFLAIVTGLLRGYPNGESIAFSPLTRVLYTILTAMCCLWIIRRTLVGRRQTMTVFIWIVMQTLCTLALLTSAIFPDHLDYGAVFTNTLNALIVSFMWYVVIAFQTCGWRDPFYYAFAGWIVCWGSRSIARILLLTTLPIGLDSLIVQTIIGFILVISVQTVFVQFVRASNAETRKLAREVQAQRNACHHDSDPAQDARKLSTLDTDSAASDSKLTRLMGLDGNESFSDLRKASMEHNARELGKQFMLSDREIEVVTLYALGFTQKRVAEELFISQGTAHAHIKRVYQKTGLHSRQELLDYMDAYTS